MFDTYNTKDEDDVTVTVRKCETLDKGYQLIVAHEKCVSVTINLTNTQMKELIASVVPTL